MALGEQAISPQTGLRSSPNHISLLVEQMNACCGSLALLAGGGCLKCSMAEYRFESCRVLEGEGLPMRRLVQSSSDRTAGVDEDKDPLT